MKYLFLLVLASTLLQAEIDPRNQPYMTTFESLAFQGESALLQTTTGTFTWTPRPFEKKMLDHWKSGDALALIMDEERPRLLLYNQNSDVAYLPAVAAVELPCITSVELKNSRAIFTLSDGSIWVSEDIDEINQWAVGDAVIVQPTEGSEVEMTDVDFIKEGRGDHWPIDARRI